MPRKRLSDKDKVVITQRASAGVGAEDIAVELDVSVELVTAFVSKFDLAPKAAPAPEEPSRPVRSTALNMMSQRDNDGKRTGATIMVPAASERFDEGRKNASTKSSKLNSMIAPIFQDK